MSDPFEEWLRLENLRLDRPITLTLTRRQVTALWQVSAKNLAEYKYVVQQRGPASHDEQHFMDAWQELVDTLVGHLEDADAEDETR